MKIEERLKELHIILPDEKEEPVGQYSPTVKSGRLIFVSGQLPKAEGRLTHQGRVGREVTLESARKAARTCVINALSALKDAIGNLDKVTKVVKLSGYVTSGVGFRDQHKVIDGASELLVEVFGEAGRHARSAVGVVELPLGAPVEIEIVFEIKGL